jgi:hypothetical protein
MKAHLICLSWIVFSCFLLPVGYSLAAPRNFAGTALPNPLPEDD